ncbi:MAG: FAD-dependent oxidoreductase [Brevundimonas sp.]|uniref:NAD(P)/FAD-dependent oxidoreductase n=1 Tax=Brevundimonas sp. TaxID=1871086 RepID=UPI002733B915|nr:FAD-dependent oxidoreductase [Brevundimonas sp.]MDP3656585.1 FAD-dependent oxidoreductase [Brevundimonas sp.]
MASSPDVIVIGAGVLGLCTAAELAARGHAVTVIDPGGPNASSIAAGMIAPALESVLDYWASGGNTDRSSLFRTARDLWPEFAEWLGISLHREGAEWRGQNPHNVHGCLRGFGFDAQPAGPGVVTADDWRIEPGPALTAMARAPGVAVIKGKVTRLTGDARRWRVEAGDGRVWFTPTVVLATGAAAAVAGLPAPLAELVDRIIPIKGQLTSVATATPPRTIRTDAVYVAPAEGGVVIGATMEPGRRDLEPDPIEAERQVAAGLALLDLTGEAGQTRVGIRGATADGLALAGPSGEPGLHLALAPRRNGWLMGPLVARVVADGIEGRPPMADAAALDPLRFA